MNLLSIIVILAAFAAGDVAAQAEVATADSVRKYKFLAKTARSKKEYAEARDYYSQLVKYSPADLQAHFFLGDMNYRLRQFDAARAAFVAALALDSLHVNSNLRLYSVYASSDVVDSAAFCLERVLLVKPDSDENRRKLADLYRREGRSERAVTHYTQLIGRGADDEELFEMLALLNQDLGQVEEALKWRRKLVGSEGEEVDTKQLESVVELQLETGDTAGAFKSLFKLALVDTVNAYSYYSRIAAIAEEQNDEGTLLKAREGMVRADPKDIQTVAQLVEWNMREDQFKAARRWLDRGLQASEDAHLLVLKGDLLLRDGAEEEAVAAYEKAKADPAWERVAQQRIWKIHPPETEEEKLKREFFGDKDGQS
jgi:tetratricopeptide (TPR) repeat protein